MTHVFLHLVVLLSQCPASECSHLRNIKRSINISKYKTFLKNRLKYSPPDIKSTKLRVAADATNNTSFASLILEGIECINRLIEKFEYLESNYNSPDIQF